MVKRKMSASLSKSPVNQQMLRESFEQMCEQYVMEQIYLHRDQIDQSDLMEILENVRDKIQDLPEQEVRTAQTA